MDTLLVIGCVLGGAALLVLFLHLLGFFVFWMSLPVLMMFWFAEALSGTQRPPRTESGCPFMRWLNKRKVTK